MSSNLSSLEKKESKKLLVPWNVSISSIKFHESNSDSTSNIKGDLYQNIPDKLLYKLRPLQLHSNDTALWLNGDNNRYDKWRKNPNKSSNNIDSGVCCFM